MENNSIINVDTIHPQWASNVTVTSPIAPTGVSLATQASNPAGAGTLWYNGTNAFIGANQITGLISQTVQSPTASSGPYASLPTVNFEFTAVSNGSSKIIVTMSWATLSTTTNATTGTIAFPTTTIPAGYLPYNTQTMPVAMIDNSANVLGYIIVSSTGSVTFKTNSGTITTAASGGFNEGSITWVTNQ